MSYLRELELWNSKAGLVKAEGVELVTRHLLDVLAAVPKISRRAGESWADLGSGAGLPGIPLAILFPDVRFSLIERSGKRAGFLRNAVALLGIAERVDVLESDLSSVAGQFDAVVFRAFRPFEPAVVRDIAKVLMPGGRMYAYKGRREVAEAELGGLSGQFVSVQIEPLSIPGLREERHLVSAVRR